MSAADRRTIVICIGNELIADDAVGFEVFSRLDGCQARIEFCCLGGIDILPLLQGETDMIVVDAVQFGAEPGTIHTIPWEKLPGNSTAISAHGLGLRETIEIGRTLYPELMPERITLVGVEGRCFNLTRDFMTREVESAISKTVVVVQSLVQDTKSEYACH